MKGICAGLLLLFFTAVAVTARSPQSPPGGLKLAAVNLVGAKRYTSSDVTSAAGLTLGQPITLNQVKEAADRLGQSGLFKSLAFRYQAKGGELTVTFEFEESDWTLPVTFDNFVWFRDDEVRAAVRDGVPSFDGTAPATAGITELIANALQKLLARRGIPGRVEFTPRADAVRGVLLGYMFAVKDPAPKICSMRIDGSSAIPQEQLLSAVRVVGSDYSRSYVDNAAKGTLADRYKQQGYWSVAFGPATAVADAGCPGVTVALNVSEGAQYTWDRAEWRGYSALAADELNILLGLKPGEVAALPRIEAGLRAVRKAYGKKGFIAHQSSYTTSLDAASRKAVFEFTIAEGPQFRCGAVEFTGFSAADVAALQKRWQLKTGEVFDESYPDRFFRDVLGPALQRTPGREVSTEMRADEQRLTVDVRYLLK